MSVTSHPDAQTLGSAQSCLHGPSELPMNRARREQAVRMAHQINRAEDRASFRGPSKPRRYLPFDELRDLPPMPDGFRLQFHISGATYMFSLKDTRDRCGFAVYSDEDGLIYEALPMTESTHIVPAEIP
jgi:hypothetical protein